MSGRKNSRSVACIFLDLLLIEEHYQNGRIRKVIINNKRRTLVNILFLLANVNGKDTRIQLQSTLLKIRVYDFAMYDKPFFPFIEVP